MCGRWETFPREFAKCRRCRKAKYCGKECQSTAWSEGHRFWCSAKDPDDDGEHSHSHSERRSATAGAVGDGRASTITSTTSGGTITGRSERRAERERDRQRAALGAVVATDVGVATDTARAVANAFRANTGMDPTVTLATLNGRPTGANQAGHMQFDYLRLLNQRVVASPETPANARRRADTVAAVSLSSTTTNGSSDLPVQLRPFLIGPPTSEASAGPSRTRGPSPRPPNAAGDGDDMLLG